MQAIRVLIVDDIRNTRESIRRILSLESDFEVVGEAGCGAEAIRLTELLGPDIVLMDISMPDIDGIKTAEVLSYRAPNSSVIMMSVKDDSEHMTKAMLAGAKAYIVKPFTGSELTSTILNIYHKEARKREILHAGPPAPAKEEASAARIISVTGTRGGVGKTTIAVNLAVELVKSKALRVLLMDLSLQFGDTASFLNLAPKRTITDLVQGGSIKLEDIRYHTLPYTTGLDVLAASTRPEYAEIVTSEHIEQIIQEVKEEYDVIICDNSSRFDDISLTALDLADEIYIVVGMDIPAIKNSKLCLEVLHSLNHTSKAKLVLNRYQKRLGIRIGHIESSLGMKVNYVLAEEEQLTALLNKGVPFIHHLPRSGPAQEIKKMADAISGSLTVQTGKQDGKIGIFSRKLSIGG